MKFSALVAVLALLAAASTRGEERPVALKDGPGRELVESNCTACHSLDYPRTNSPFMGRKAWGAEVNKMINVFGAPIAPEDAGAIVDYLAKNYGTGD